MLDLYCDKGTLYALGIQETEDGNYISSVYSITNGESQLLFSLLESTFPISLAVSQNDFYLGFGYLINSPEISGTIIKYNCKGDLQ